MIHLNLVHYGGTLLLDGTKFESTRDRDKPLTIKLGEGGVVKGLDHGVVSMKKGEIVLFTLPAELGYGVVCGGGYVVPSNAVEQRWWDCEEDYRERREECAAW